MVVQEMPQARVSSWLGLTVPAAMMLGMAIGGWTADRYSRINPRALFVVPGAGDAGVDPVPPGGDLWPGRGGDLSAACSWRSL